ncbi:Uncharacterised protein [Legionella pneumophila]|uniref:Uncharacterized protein n=1 Tax=Fluoribacter dumoffii TaxID=463 RepID=A0A377GB98_9GAMM|nr:Uncharacterised protein [Legionella pneumophila]STO22107.1 Uncharacterised protein [Fluoribacter dumoffii]
MKYGNIKGLEDEKRFGLIFNLIAATYNIELT